MAHKTRNSKIRWRVILSDGTKKIVSGHTFSDGLDAAQKLDSSVDDIDMADNCPGECYCDENQGCGYTYMDEFGECNHCSHECDCCWWSGRLDD